MGSWIARYSAVCKHKEKYFEWDTRGIYETYLKKNSLKAANGLLHFDWVVGCLMEFGGG